MPLPFRILFIAAVSLLVSCSNSGEQTEAPVSTTIPVATSAAEPAPEVPQSQDEVAVAPPVDAVTPDRDATRTEDKPVIEGRDLPEPQETTAPPAPAPTTTPAPAPAPESDEGRDPDDGRDLGAPPPAPVPEPEPEPEAVEEAPEVVEEIAEIVVNTPSHQAWDDILRQYVDANGLVNYAGLKQNEAKLDAYLETLAAATPNGLWSRNDGLTYWINAYNAYTFKLILNNYPVGSITDLDGGDPWKVKWIELGDKTYSLNNIEHDIIRPQYEDPRIHFAVVCAAKSCPPLLNRAFDSDMLNRQLDLVTRKFINNSKFNETQGDVRISKIFDWYQEDFGDVKAYLNRYLSQKIPADKAIGYQDYDWSLNKQ